MAKPLILVVDDQAEIRQVLEKLLKTNGYQVEDAADGKEAIEKIKTGLFDVVITCRSSLRIKMKKHRTGNHYNKEYIE